MEPTDFEKWCAKETGMPLNRIMRWKFGDGYTEGAINAMYRAYMAGVRSRLPYQTPQKEMKMEWIKCSEKLPEESGRYLCYVEEVNCLGKSHYQWNCSWNGGCFRDDALSGTVTHWLPLPQPPEE